MKNTPKLCVGMSTYEDFDSIYFTIQSLRTYHREAVKKCELIVVNQSLPASQHTDYLKGLIGNVQGDFISAKMVQMHSPAGTSPGRQRLFEESTAPAVLCMDSHVILPELGSLDRLIQFYEDGKDKGDLLHGPMVMDNLSSYITHMDPIFRAEMFGVWGSLQWPENVESVEIPMHGLGLFSSRKDAWLEYGGFNKRFRGFGAEEGYVHERFKQAGHKVQLLTFLKWLHKFARSGGVKYRLTREDKVRNYIIGWQEIGWDIDIIKKHFMEEIENPMSQETWDFIVHNIENNEEWPPPVETKKKSCGSCGAKKPSTEFKTVDEAFEMVKAIPRDLNEHMDKLKELASQVSHVTEFSERRESTLAFLAAKPKMVVSHNKEYDETLKQAYEFVKENTVLERDTLPPDEVGEIKKTELLFLDYDHTAGGAYGQLVKYGKSVNRYIVFHDTDIYGMTAPDGKPGMLAGIQKYLKENPQWSIILHTKQQYGLTVLSCRVEDKPKKPNKVKMAASFAKAMTKYVASGGKDVTKEQLEARLSVCTMCEHRVDGACSICGCPLEKKAKMASENCPLALWPRLDTEEQKDEAK